MTASEILNELEALGTASYKKLLMRNHGVKEPCFGVKIGDMKPIVKRIKKSHQLALDLFRSGNYDAMYLAGLIADEEMMTRENLQEWVNAAEGGSLPGSTVPGVAAGSLAGWDMALEWIDSPIPRITLCGWQTLAGIVALKMDEELDLKKLEKLLGRVEKEIKQAPDLARYGMNSFLIAVGTYVVPLHRQVLEMGERIGKLHADLGNNSCEIPFAPEYLRKVVAKGVLGKKRKTLKC